MDGGLDKQQGKVRGRRPHGADRPALEARGSRPVFVLRSASEEPLQPAEETASPGARGGRRSGRGSGGGLGCGRRRSFLRWGRCRLARGRVRGPAHLLVVAAQDGVLRYASAHLLVMPSQNGICRHGAHDRLLRLKATLHCNQYAIGITRKRISRRERTGAPSARRNARVPNRPRETRNSISVSSDPARRRRGPGFVDASRWRPGMPVRCEARSLRRRTWRRS